MANGVTTAEDPNLNLEDIKLSLEAEGGGAGLSFDELIAGGLSALQAQTRLAGFTGAFGGGTAQAFRSSEEGSIAFLQAVAETQDIPITDFVSGQIKDPTLPAEATFTPAIQTVQEGELLTAPELGEAPTIAAPTIAEAPTIRQILAEAGIVDEDEILALLGAVPKLEAQLTGGAEQAVAEQGEVSELATVAGQLESLLGGDNPQVQNIFNSAIAKVSDELGARGLASSTLAGDAIIEAVTRQALPIAAQDAATFFQMDIQNLSNRQQTTLENTRLRQQALLTDTALLNATQQFNATNEIQRQEFTANLVTQIRDQNAARVTSVSQFNAAQANLIESQNVQNIIGISKANAEMELAVSKYNSELINQREIFNANSAFAVEQSNVVWRRNINTANTAATNAATQANVQNSFNLSTSAQNNIWQQFRDESYWLFQAGQSDLDRQYSAAQAANNRQFNSRDDTSWMTQLGSFAANFLL